MLRLVLDLYTRQRVTATWTFKKSYSFNVTNGVRQGGVLSPVLINVYFDELLQRLKQNGIGCHIQYIPRNMHTVFALLCFVMVIHWLIFPYPSGLLHWHCGNLTIAPVPAKQPWWIWINTSCEFIMNDCITTTKQSTTKPWAYFLGYTVRTIFTGALCYANDMSLLCPTTRGLQKMISVCSEFAEEYNVVFNTNKTACMTFGNRPICPVVYLYLNGESLNGLTT